MASIESPKKEASAKDLEKEAEDNTSDGTSVCTLGNISENNPEVTLKKKQKFIVERALNARRFAEELVEFILQKFGYSLVFDSKIRDLPRNAVQRRFLKEVGEAVYDLLSCHIDKISTAYTDLQERNINKMEAFRKQLCITGAMYLKENYDLPNFLVMAASFTGVTVLYFQKGENENEVLLATVQVLAYFLNYFICYGKFKGEDWFQLCLSAQGIRRKLIDSKAISDYVFPRFDFDKIA